MHIKIYQLPTPVCTNGDVAYLGINCAIMNRVCEMKIKSHIMNDHPGGVTSVCAYCLDFSHKLKCILLSVLPDNPQIYLHWNHPWLIYMLTMC